MTMADQSGRWLLNRARRPAAAFRLYCFPHSGGSPGEYMKWSDWLPEAEVWVLQIAGRGSRIAEPPVTSMDELVPAITQNVAFQPPFAFFGHSVGSLVAYEVALALRTLNRCEPAALYVSAAEAPHLHRPALRSLDTLNDEQLIAEIEAKYGALPPELMNDRALRELLLPALRADLTIDARYRYVPAEPLACPITILGGSADSYAESDLAGWREHTTGCFQHRMLPGDHFYFREHTDEFERLLRDSLAELATGGRIRSHSLAPS